MAGGARKPPGGPLLTSFAVSAAIQALNVLTGVLLARILGPHGRGELAAVLLWPSVLAVLGSLGLVEAATFHAARSSFALGTLVGTTLAFILVQSTVLVGIGIVLIPRILGHYGASTVHVATLFLAAHVPLALLTYNLSAIVNGLQRFGAFQLLRVVAFAGVGGALVTFTMTSSLTVKTAAVAYIVADLITLVCAAGFVLRAGIFPLRFNVVAARKLIGYGLRSHANTVSSAFNQRLDQLCISAFLPPVKLGLYVVATTMSSLTALVGWSVAMVTLPTIARLDSGRQRAEAARRLVRLTLLASVLVTLPLVLIVPNLIELFFGSPFHGATNVTRVLLIGALFLSTNQTLASALQGVGRPLDAGIAEFVALTVTFAGLAVLLPTLGLVGAAVASLLAYAASTAMMARRLGKALELPARTLFVPNPTEVRGSIRQMWTFGRV